MNTRRRVTRTTLCTALLALAAGPAGAAHYGPWGDAVPEPGPLVNVAGTVNGCPIESKDGLELYIASTRETGKHDIFRFSRPFVGALFDRIEHLDAPVNEPAYWEYCPTPLQGNWLLFVSSRVVDDDCHPGDVEPGGSPPAGDIYLTRRSPATGDWNEPLNLGCLATGGPNTAGHEFSPSLVETAEGTFLYFSSNGYPDDGLPRKGGHDIYVSRVQEDGTIGPGQRVVELSGLLGDGSPAQDLMPNVRKDGLEMVFSSNRTNGGADQDIYVATRASTAQPWSAPVRIANPNVNTTASETRASLSGDGLRLHFGRNNLIYASERQKNGE